jgi:hypothetical protein
MGYKHEKITFHNSGGWEFQDEGTVYLVSGEGYFLVRAVFWFIATLAVSSCSR